MDTIKNDKYVNGPLNIVRLEGSINSIKKVLYIFMDVHIPISNQKECENLRATDLKEFLVDEFDKMTKKDKLIDFFFEIKPTWLADKSIDHYTDIYIREVVKLFKQGFNIDPKRNRVVKSKEFPNVRLHYMDIRDYTNIDYWMNLGTISSDIIQHGFSQKYINDLRFIISKLDKDMNFIKSGFFNKKEKTTKPKPTIPQSKERYTEKEVYDRLARTIDKIKKMYSHQSVKQGIHQLIDDHLKKMIDRYFKIKNDYQSFLNDIEQKILPVRGDQLVVDKYVGPRYGFSNHFYEDMIANNTFYLGIFIDITINIYSFLTDLFFLRRFLDKDYIHNAIVYTGAAHSMNYIYSLVTNFNFKITHASYIKDQISKVENELRKAENIQDQSIYFYPPVLDQCSNMKGFPKDFE